MHRPTRSEPVITAPEMHIAQWLTDMCMDVIYLFQMAAANVNVVDVVLAMCRVEDDDTRGNIITWEGFETLEGLGILEDDKDVIEMAKRMASRNQNQGRVILSMVTNQAFASFDLVDSRSSEVELAIECSRVYSGSFG